MFTSNNHIRFTCGEKKICSNIKKCQNFRTRLTARIIKISNILAGIYFIFVKKKHPRPNLKGFQYQIWISVKRSEKL